MSDNKLSRAASNAGWIIFERVLQMLISLVVSLMTARFLGPANYGLLNYAGAYTGFFSALCTLGINSIIVKEFVDNPGKEGEILGSSFFLRLLSSIFSSVVILCIVYVADNGDPTVLAVVFLKCIAMILQMVELCNYWFHSQLQSKTAAKVAFCAYLITTVYKIAILVFEKDILWFAMTSVIDGAALMVLMLLAFKRSTDSQLRISYHRGREILRKSYHFILPRLMIAVYAQTDKIMLKQMIGDAETGCYATAVSICATWYFVLSAIIDSMNPVIMEAHKKDDALYVRRNKQLYAMIFYISVAAAVVISLLSEPAILLLYGNAYARAVAPLRVVAWNAAFSYLAVARNAWIVCEGRQNTLKYVYASAAAANIALNVILIPRWGAVGAAIASLMAQIAITIVVPFFMKTLRGNAVMMLQAIMLRGMWEKRKNQR